MMRVEKQHALGRLWRFSFSHGVILRLLTISLLSCGCILVASINSTASAEDTNAGPLKYRRIYVPANKLDAWPREGEKLIPIESQEFDEWVRSAENQNVPATHRAVIDRAEYSARIQDGTLQGKIGRAHV